VSADRIAHCGDGKAGSGCGAPIRWGLTEKRAPVPLDAEPITDEKEAGFVFVDGADVSTSVVWRRHETANGRPRYRSHFASCPAASEFRRKR
jgi:hypothetical protein